MHSPEETHLVEALLPPEGPNTLGADAAVDAFQSADLHPSVLAKIWDIVDEGQKGELSREEVAKSIRLIGWAQRGFAIEPALLEQVGPLADLCNPTTPEVASPFILLPPLSSANRAKYLSIYERAGPEKDSLHGVQAWKLFMMSKLPIKTLTRIWDLVDTKKSGRLTFPAFSIAMYLIHGMLEHHFTSLPPSIPAYLHDQASGIEINDHKPSSSSSLILYEDVLANAFTTDFYFIRASTNLDLWSLPPLVKKHADTYFAVLDSENRGYIDGDQTVPFMLQSFLPSEELERIWDTIDSTSKGHLTADDFALALFVIYKKLAGCKIPHPLPWNARTQTANIRCDSLSSEVHKPVLKRRPSQLPSPKERHNLELSQELDLIRAQLESTTQLRLKEKSALHNQIHELQNYQHELLTENSELRMSLRNASHSMRRSISMHTDKSNSIAAENANMRKQLRQAEDAQVRMRNVHEAELLEISKENQMMQVKMANIGMQLESRNTDYDVQKLYIEDLTSELDRLRARVQELRDNENVVPSSNGDEDLQRQINEDIAKENRNLRAHVAQIAESLEQAQAAIAHMVPRTQLEEASRENVRLSERVLNAERQTEDLQREVVALKGEIRRQRAARQTVPAPADDVPPPAYEVVSTPA